MLHDKLSLLYLTHLMVNRGIHHVVISPGSRNAPLVEALAKEKTIKCISVVDERSAGFFALGMAQQLHKPVAVLCTSGSAALNYSPAVAEAFYQRIPLLVLTADRPVELIDQGDGQTIRQNNVYSNFIKKSISLPQSIKTKDDLWYINRLISEALNACIYPVAGPVHINLPFSEPLYGQLPTGDYIPPKDFVFQEVCSGLPDKQALELAALWNSCSRKMILVGQMDKDDGLNDSLKEISDDPSVVVLTETTSNIYHSQYVQCIDRCLAAIKENIHEFQPELLVSIGGAVVSKRIKAFLRNSNIKHHWHVDKGQDAMDTYKHLTKVIPLPAAGFFKALLPFVKYTKSEFSRTWKDLSSYAASVHQKFSAQAQWSDFRIFQMLMDAVPENYDIQLSNSTPVRYSQLFEHPYPFSFFSNRGTSGIDGCVSTAAGACFASSKPTLLITGDLSFFYDSNALWNKHLPPGLRIIVINNEGGGIFRFIEGPDTTGLLEEFFEARHRTSARNIALAHNVDYNKADNPEELSNALESFFKAKARASILEVNSPPEESALILKSYFRALSS